MFGLPQPVGFSLVLSAGSFGVAFGTARAYFHLAFSSVAYRKSCRSLDALAAPSLAQGCLRMGGWRPEEIVTSFANPKLKPQALKQLASSLL